jgi:hypothetical protein
MSEIHVVYPNANDYKWQGDPNVSIVGSGFSVPRGLEAQLNYNGLVMNDLSVFDKYRIMSIDGLADPDIRDTREDKPGEDGEDAYDSYYSGRTIVIQVRVEAYELKKLRDMEEALRTAFIDMQEKPLYFLTDDPEKDHFIMCKKSTSLTKQEDIQNLNFRHFRDWQITLRASDPRFYRSIGKTESAAFSDSYQTNAINIGNYTSMPIIKLFGQMSNITLVNDNEIAPFNNIKFSSAVQINSNDFYVIDIKNKTIKDSSGNNQISKLDPSSGWLRLRSGNNVLAFAPETVLSSGSAQLVVEWKDAWI